MSATSSLTTSVVVTMAAPDGTSFYRTSLSSQPLETQIYQNTEPTTTSESEPVATVAPEIPERIVHRLTIDLGACAGFTLPRLQLIAGELGDLVAIGAGKFEVEIGPDPELNYFGLGVSLKDDGARCGSEGDPFISITTGGNFGLEISVIRSGGYSKAMYPFNIWLKDGVVWDTHPANSPEEAYHCWGWGGDECPYTFKNSGGTGSAGWTLSSENPAGDVHIDFCPTDGPIWSSILPNPSPESSGPTHQSTYVILPTQTTVSTSTFTRPFLEATKPSVLTITKEADCDQPLGCISYSTYFVEESITSYRSTFITPLPWTTKYGETKVIPDAPTTVLETTFFTTPPPTTTPSMLGAITITSTEPPSVQGVRPSSTLTELGVRPTTSDSPPTVIQTYSYITDNIGSTVSTSSYDVTVSPEPTTTSTPDAQRTLTTWSTWMTVNGSTIPAIAGEVGVLSTVSATYLFESGSVIPLSELSTRTAAPSPTAAASANDNPNSHGRGGKIAGAVVGTLVGLVLGGILLWYICHRRQRRHMRNSFARGGASWLETRNEVGSSDGSRMVVDLDEEPRMDQSYVEPWVEPRTRVPVPRKGGHAEMESVLGGHEIVSAVIGPRRMPKASGGEGVPPRAHDHRSRDQHQHPVVASVRTGKLTTRDEPTRRPDAMVSQRPVPSSYLNPSLANPSLVLPLTSRNGSPSPPTPVAPPTRGVLPPRQASPPQAGPSRRRREDEEQGGHDAIPPLYNEAWKDAR
ncbi:unnamed protein product [Rhizoctonia solani]|uniref:Uncharacterized protein n=1 Tax=Rhizoctonia solani TaxID=456999 RepID=A0A8H2XK20_9AGAM|nr:unnamed protein product [Rhizoctonia solani]